MKKLTDEKCREQFEEWFADHAGQTVAWVKSQRASDTHYKIGPEIQRYWLTWQASREALEIALPILEQQEMITHSQTVITDNAEMITDNSVQPREGEWMEWNGGECPVRKGTLVDVRLRDGSAELSAYAWGQKDDVSREFKASYAGWAFWLNEGDESDIIAYRIIPEQPTNQNGEQ